MSGLTRDAKVDHIVGLMERGEWVRGKSVVALAREWGEPESTVRNYSQEAWGVAKREIQDPDRVKADVAAILRGTLDRAVEAGKFGVAAKLGDVLTRILGARAAEKHEVVMSEEAARQRVKDITGMTWEEIQAKRGESK